MQTKPAVKITKKPGMTVQTEVKAGTWAPNANAGQRQAASGHR
jgi:hypothetical protein